MSGIWIYSENAQIASQLLTAGLELKEKMQEPVNALVLNEEAAFALAAAGADRVIVLKGKGQRPENFRAAAANLWKKEQASVCLIGGTLRGKDFAAGAAAKLETGLVTDALSVSYENGKIETTRVVYGGLAVRKESLQMPAMVTIPARVFLEAPEIGGTGVVSIIDADVEEKGLVVKNTYPIVREGADISVACRVVCVGRGLAKKEDLSLAKELAVATGAEIGCTRGIAEDYHWLPNDRYIGISGQKIKPELYIGIGISGQVQHVAGIRDTKIIVAIDSNEKAPIFESADYGIVGDLYEVVPLLTAALEK